MRKNSRKDTYKPWPQNCLWPEPVRNGRFWEAEDADSFPLDEEAEDLLEIKEYMDEMVQCGRLNADYSLNADYEDEDGEDGELWIPEKGEDYWDDGFEIDIWQEELAEHLNLLKLPLPSPVDDIQRIIGYEFINENLLRQAFTRRAFSLEYGTGNNEVLEFLGDTALNTVVTREIGRQLTEVDCTIPGNPFSASYPEGDLTRIRQQYICGEYLASRAAALGLDQYILYGSQEEASESAGADMMEALIGAVAADCDWDWHTIEGVVDRLLCIQLSGPMNMLKSSFYDTFNSWHQKKFGRMPEYEVSKGSPVGAGLKEFLYSCTLRFSIPENDKGIWTSQRVDVQRETRSKARELAAEEAYRFVVNNGLWMNLSDAGVEPKLEDSINQLQELYQKKYVDEPVYSFEERDRDEWYCSCVCGGVEGWGRAVGKTPAKKRAAFMVLVGLLESAGICKEEWKQAVWKLLEQ